MKALALLVFLLPLVLRAQIPVTDAANLAANQTAHSATIAKWIESISNLRTQIDQLNRQINIQDDLRRWSGNPVEAGAKVALEGLGEGDLVRQYGRARTAVRQLSGSFDSLQRTLEGNYRAIANLDLDGREMQRDPLLHRRYAVLAASHENAEQVTDETQSRAEQLQREIAATLGELKQAPTEAETQKLAAKLAALNGQLQQVESVRQREVDAVLLQKIANDSRLEEERVAAAELAARDDYLANQRVSAYMRNLKVRSHATR